MEDVNLKINLLYFQKGKMSSKQTELLEFVEKDFVWEEVWATQSSFKNKNKKVWKNISKKLHFN